MDARACPYCSADAELCSNVLCGTGFQRTPRSNVGMDMEIEIAAGATCSHNAKGGGLGVRLRQKRPCDREARAVLA